MSVVEVTVNGRNYQLACDDGEEGHLLDLAAYFDGRVSELAGSVGQVGEARLMLMAGLLVADDLSGVVDRLDPAGQTVNDDKSQVVADSNEIEGICCDLDDLTSRVDRLAKRLETS